MWNDEAILLRGPAGLCVLALATSTGRLCIGMRIATYVMVDRVR